MKSQKQHDGLVFGRYGRRPEKLYTLLRVDGKLIASRSMSELSNMLVAYPIWLRGERRGIMIKYQQESFILPLEYICEFSSQEEGKEGKE